MSSTTPTLRPLGVADILDQAIRIYRQNFVPLVEIVAVVAIPVLLVQVIGTGLTMPWTNNFSSPPVADTFSNPAILFSTQGLAALLAAIGTIFEIGALSHFVSERYLDRPATFRSAYGKAFHRWLALVLAAILFGLAAAAIFGVFIAVFFAAAMLSTTGGGNSAAAAAVGLATICLCVLFIPAIVGFLYLSVRWMFFVQAIVLENFNSTGGLGRSWKLVKGYFWRTLGFYLVLTILVAAFTTGPVLLFQIGAFLLPSPALGIIIAAIAQTLLRIIITPIQYGALTVYYYDLRVRKEGLDLQMQLNAYKQNQLPPADPGVLPSGAVS